MRKKNRSDCKETVVKVIWNITVKLLQNTADQQMHLKVTFLINLDKPKTRPEAA